MVGEKADPSKLFLTFRIVPLNLHNKERSPTVPFFSSSIFGVVPAVKKLRIVSLRATVPSLASL